MKTRRVPDTGPHRTRTEPELPTPLAEDPLVSTQMGEFVIEERIGAGGMGVVYRAVHPLIGKQAAVKVLRAELMSPEQEQRLLVEARTVNAIRHPGILDIFNFGRLADGRPYIVMELLRGQPLSEVMRAQGRLDVGTTVWMLDQMASALGAAHRAGVVHRDLKPANVFVVEVPDAAPTLKLVDFGIAKVLRSHEGLTLADGAVLGTPDFMAPEQIRGGAIGPATDLYALGVLAFQMLTGEKPFQGENVQVMFAHVEQPAPRPSSRVKGLPPQLDALVLQLMEKDPTRRPASAEAVREQLRGLARTTPTRPEVEASPSSPRPGLLAPLMATRPEAEAPTSPSSPLPWRLAALLMERRRRAPLVAAGVAALVLLATGLWALTRAPEAPPALSHRLPMPPAPTVSAAPASAPNRVKPPEAQVPTPATPAVAPPTPNLPDVPPEEARDATDIAPGTEAKATGLPSLPLGSPSEKRLARRLFGLFKQLRARAKDVDAEGELRGRLVQQYRAAVDADDPERARIHLALDAWEKVLAERIARHDAPPPVVQPVVPRHPPLVIPTLPALPRGSPAELKLAQRLDRLVAELRQRTQGQDVAPELTRQLVKLYGSAAGAQTATQRMEVNQALDAWQEQLKARLPK
ncbi:protein kinase [Corallococcus sp. bb12-1]|uniref:serine/threonine-protein kinase n=1 Tax=Corallococcus sp. bb12-1 TaxID=2996784 RepID=UPI00226E45E9|nr:serine/threonine-protein kinase [Corallococcus sp. bb12-1]MCY1043099.1 protein kinase [Corallococcus sp. bb12-1]